MFAIVSKDDGFPICRQVLGVVPDPVVTWNSEAAAAAFLASRRAEAEFVSVPLTDDVMESIAIAMDCSVQAITFEPYPD